MASDGPLTEPSASLIADAVGIECPACVAEFDAPRIPLAVGNSVPCPECGELCSAKDLAE